jgi:hypothetical protein
MSKADQLLSKLPPPTQLPSFVTDALKGNQFSPIDVVLCYKVELISSLYSYRAQQQIHSAG